MDRTERAKETAIQFAPEFRRSSVNQRASQIERPLIALYRDINEIGNGLHRRVIGRDCCNRLLASASASLNRFRKIGRYISAGSAPPGGISFGKKLLVGDHGRRA